MRMPGISRTRMFVGRLVPSSSTQTMSERFTLFSGISLCRSQYSYGPKKFQFGPLRNVPSRIRMTQRTRNPNWKVVGELALADRIVAVARLVGVDVGHRHQADDDHARQHHARHP